MKKGRQNGIIALKFAVCARALGLQHADACDLMIQLFVSSSSNNDAQLLVRAHSLIFSLSSNYALGECVFKFEIIGQIYARVCSCFLMASCGLNE